MGGGWLGYGLTACRPKDVNPTWGPREEEECRTPLKTDGNCGLHRAERTAWVCPLDQAQPKSPWWRPAPAQHPAGLHPGYPSGAVATYLAPHSSDLNSPLPSHDDDDHDVLPTQPRGDPPSAQPLGSPVLGFSSFSLVLEQIKAG